MRSLLDNLRLEDEIISTWKGNLTPLVSISCITYNHVAYIAEALRGFLIQVTDFPFEILIHDDASIDGTASILRDYAARYPKLIKVIFQSENQYSKGGTKVDFEFNFPRVQGEFIAQCEGDDFWFDPHKLQKQIDFLRVHPSYSLCGHLTEVIDQDGRGQTPPRVMGALLPVDFSIRHVLANMDMHINSVCFRRSCWTNYLRTDPGYTKLQRAVGSDDALMWIVLAQGKGHCLKVSMSKYRVHEGGVWSSMTALHRQLARLQLRVLALGFIGAWLWPRQLWIIVNNATELVYVTCTTCVRARSLAPVGQVIALNRRMSALPPHLLFLVCSLGLTMLPLRIWQIVRVSARKIRTARDG